jgi:heat shock protein HslJ
VSDVSGTQQLGQGAPRPAASLEGMPWLAVFYAGPEGRLRPVLLDTEVTATFQGGRVSGSAGCNTYTAGYQLAQDTAGIIRLEPAATTLRACAEPAGVMEQEAAYLAALPTATRYLIEGDRLTLQRQDGTDTTRVATYAARGT